MNQTLEQLVNALGWTLLHSLWQGIIIGALFVVSRRVLSSANPVVRHTNALIWLLLFVALPVFTFAGLLVAEPGSVAAAGTGLSTASLSSMAVGTADQPAALAVLGALWLSGVLVLSLNTVRDWRELNRLTRVDVAALPQLEAKLALLRETLEVHVNVRLVEAVHASVPMVVGVLKPMIVLPSSALLGLSPRELELIIAHELGHLKRQDHLINYLLIAAETLLFFHPVVYTLTKTIRHERELCCDDLVISTFHDRVCYAHALSKLEALRSTSVAPNLQLAAADGPLVTRISRLVKQRTHRSYGLLPLVLLPMVAAVFTFAVFHHTHRANSESLSREVRSVIDTFSDSIGHATRRHTALEPIHLSDYARRRVAASSVSKITDALTRKASPVSLNRMERGINPGINDVSTLKQASATPAVLTVQSKPGVAMPDRRHAASTNGVKSLSDSGGRAVQAASNARAQQDASIVTADRQSPERMTAPEGSGFLRETTGRSEAPRRESAEVSLSREERPSNRASRIAYDMTAIAQPLAADRLSGILAYPLATPERNVTNKKQPLSEASPPKRQATGEAKSGDVLSGGDLIYSVTPKYPDRARSRGLVDRVVVSIKVSTDGSVNQVSFVNSDSRPMFQRAVKRAVSRWKFEPLRRNGEVVEQTVEQSFNFTLQPYSANRRGSACQDSRRSECRLST